MFIKIQICVLQDNRCKVQFFVRICLLTVEIELRSRYIEQVLQSRFCFLIHVPVMAIHRYVIRIKRFKILYYMLSANAGNN